MADTNGIDKELVSLILFGRGDRQRFVQDTPILPDVWHAFAERPGKRRDLLISPLDSCSALRALRAIKKVIKDRLTARGLSDGDVINAVAEVQLAPLQSYVAACLTFNELVTVILPRTAWAAKARERFGEVAAAGFSPSAAVEQVLDAAEGLAPRRQDALRGQVFEAARILTLVALIQARQDDEAPGVNDIGDVRSLKDAVAARVGALIDRLLAAGPIEAIIGRVTGNREVSQATLASRETVKADAAFRVFAVRCQDITWGVIDSGIDPGHRAFRGSDGNSRVVRSYELGILRQLLNSAYEDAPEANPILDRCIKGAKLEAAAALRYLANAYQSFATDILDWSSIEPLLRLAEPSAPADGHGTHVAGIIGGNWVEEDKVLFQGLCPDIRLIDFRIIGRDLDETEYAVLGALQLVRYLNSHNQYIVVHGVNMSLSIPHKVGSFACGRTPVCMEAERLIGAGTTVVAAAGNEGHHDFVTSRGGYQGYAAMSITDPGNAEGVITVGATHKSEPHAYGISYFSSRGPTADGRSKPDLVAPGERIESALPGDEKGFLDGTSQAAPHVSAAAAMLMARYPELNREPRRIKKLLCDNATDLGRERSFQGHGLLDVLRALQGF